MLVLTRKIQQQIQIGPHITITILQVKGNAVRVGIEAPRDVRIIRRELEVQLPSDAEPGADCPAAAPLADSRHAASAPLAPRVKLSLAV